MFAGFSISNFLTLYSVRVLAVDATRRTRRLHVAFYQVFYTADVQQVCVCVCVYISRNE